MIDAKPGSLGIQTGARGHGMLLLITRTGLSGVSLCKVALTIVVAAAGYMKIQDYVPYTEL